MLRRRSWTSSASASRAAECVDAIWRSRTAVRSRYSASSLLSLRRIPIMRNGQRLCTAGGLWGSSSWVEDRHIEYQSRDTSAAIPVGLVTRPASGGSRRPHLNNAVVGLVAHGRAESLGLVGVPVNSTRAIWCVATPPIGAVMGGAYRCRIISSVPQ